MAYNYRLFEPIVTKLAQIGYLYVSASLDPEKTNLEFDLCIICQKGEKESLVCKPSIDSYGKVLDFVKEWASYGNKQYSEAWVKLQDISVKDQLRKRVLHGIDPATRVVPTQE